MVDLAVGTKRGWDELSGVENEQMEPKDQIRWVEDCKPEEEGESWYLISKQWYSRWKKYCIRMGSDSEGARTLGSSTEPGPIRNDELFSHDKLLSNLKWTDDFYIVSEIAWSNLVKWYGCKGEVIKRKIIRKGDRLHIELYPPVITILYPDSPYTISQEVDKYVRTVSENTLIREILYYAKLYYGIGPDEEVQLVALENPFEFSSPSVLPQYLQEATEINLSDPNARVGQSGNLTWLIRKKESDKFPRGKCGLMNLGNTCYMNSAVQCLSNTPQLTEWFLSGNYKYDINKHNPLGTKGLLAEAYGDLIGRMWTSGKSCTRPLRFRNLITKFNPIFEGFQQHDTQELLAFLLDALHEDLNRVLEKPYVELPNFDTKKDSEIAKYSWDYHLTRNNSIIVDLFQGQFKSKLICNNCQGVSVTFDPFMYVSLPLPTKKTITIELCYVPYDPSQRIQRIALDLPKEACVIHLQQKLADLFHTTPESLIVVDIFKNTIYETLAYNKPIETILPSDIIYVYEIPGLTTLNRKQKFFSMFPNAEGREEEIIVFPVYCAIVPEDDDYPIHFGHLVLVAMSMEDASDPNKIYCSIVERLERYATIDLYEELSIESLSVCDPGLENVETNPSSQASTSTEYARKKVQPIANLFKIKLFSSKHLCDFEKGQILPRGIVSPHLTIEPTVNYETVKELRHHLGIDSSQDFDDLLEDQSLYDDYPWIYEYQPPNRTRHYRKPLIKQGEGIWLQWTEMKAKRVFGISVNPVFKGVSRSTWDDYDDFVDQTGTENQPTLADCLDEFTKEEELGKDDLWFCPKCKEQQHVTKKLDLWKLPKIMVIHLKRFSHSRYLDDKIDDYIDFPITGLDMTDRVLSMKDPDSVMNNNRLIYDLYAVDNHYGNLKGGHYTTIAQNFDNGQWYTFDDSKVTEAQISDVKTSAAYLLFYKRRLGENRNTD